MNYLHDQKIKGIMKTLKTIKIIQSLEFIRSSLNSLDVAAEFECARGLSLLMLMMIMIQGVFFTGPPPEQLKYGKLMLGSGLMYLGRPRYT